MTLKTTDVKTKNYLRRCKQYNAINYVIEQNAKKRIFAGCPYNFATFLLHRDLSVMIYNYCEGVSFISRLSRHMRSTRHKTNESISCNVVNKKSSDLLSLLSAVTPCELTCGNCRFARRLTSA